MKEKRLNGRWMEVYLNYIHEYNKDSVVWTFSSNEMSRYQSFIEGGIRKFKYDTFNYAMKRKNLEWIVSFESKNNKTMPIAGKYVIDKLKKDILILIPLDAYPRMEFYKIK